MNGLRIETAAGVVARDTIAKHLTLFGPAIRRDKIASTSTVAAYIDGLAGAVALTVAGGHGSKDEVLEASIRSLREAVNRDLRHLKMTP